MAKRELSGTLKNLKFMQRAAQKEEKIKKEEEEEEVKPDGNFFSMNTHNRKCIVIMEGNPNPGALKGRMSFQSFNPYVDKLNEEATNPHQPQASATSSSNQLGRTCDRENESLQNGSEGLNEARPNSDSDGDHKRKQPEIQSETDCQNKSKKNLDWSVLRSPTAHNRRAMIHPIDGTEIKFSGLMQAAIV
ncbi:hypothetical protein HHK36_011026 [Tetracentron sinense]|uniref:M-phase phosphoprotein 6 n=1 Tax=Tetracentron sinense TaxID=13715 RepID=A0A835DFV0_TETSI|nr:hypothetical protein HHK36_011026 [Tetracentron sinense]